MMNEAQHARCRPVWVWVIAAFYLLTVGWTLLGYALIFRGEIELDAAQEAYFASVMSIDVFFGVAISLINVMGALALFVLRRVAADLFVLAFTLNVLQMAFQLLWTNWLEAFGNGGLVGVLLAWCILLAVIQYARGLVTRGILV